jgi:uncharacterized LabA/DUF88 family protein/cold shock CspA family protein
MQSIESNLLRIGVFYDGNFFYHVSNYYSYAHQRRARISIDGLHRFIRQQVADAFNTDLRLSQIVDAHYFRGRLSAAEASSREKLIYHERVFDDILVASGVTTHYLPVRSYGGRFQEKGIDVWLALEAYELSVYKHFNVVVLIAGDGDYVPLVRKLNTLGIRVMVLGWDFDTVNEYGKQFSTRTSHDLMDEATHPIEMHRIIDDPDYADDSFVKGLFVFARENASAEGEKNTQYTHSANALRLDTDIDDEDDFNRADTIETDGVREEGEISVLKEGYGFVGQPPQGTFFHYSDLTNCDFNDLHRGDRLTYEIGIGPEGKKKAINIELLR